MPNLEHLLRQAAQQCIHQEADNTPASLEARRLRCTGSAIEQALAFLTGVHDAELGAQRDHSERNIAAFTALQRVTGQRGMVFLPNRDYVQDLHDYCARQGIAAPPLPALGGYEH